MASRPWYKRYPSNFLAGTVKLTLEQKGAYSVCLDLIYDHGGPIDDDPQWISRACGCSTRKWNQIRAKLIDVGKLTSRDGLLSNEKAEREMGISGLSRLNLDENQTLSREQVTEIKPVSNENSDLDNESLATRAHVQSTELTIPPDVLTNVTPQGVDATAGRPPEKPAQKSKPPPTKGHRLPDDWQPSASCRAFARENGFAESEIDGIADEFRDYWTDESGNRAAKKSWDGTWRNRIRELAKRRASRGSPRQNGQSAGQGNRREPASFTEAALRYAARNSPAPDVPE